MCKQIPDSTEAESPSDPKAHVWETALEAQGQALIMLPRNVALLPSRLQLALLACVGFLLTLSNAFAKLSVLSAGRLFSFTLSSGSPSLIFLCAVLCKILSNYIQLLKLGLLQGCVCVACFGE